MNVKGNNNNMRPSESIIKVPYKADDSVEILMKKAGNEHFFFK